MKTSSAKQKGRRHQQYVRDKICEIFPELIPEQDVINRSSGSPGEDLILSTFARTLLPLSFECKNLAKIAVYKFYNQCIDNAKNLEPVVVIKQNQSKPLVIVDLDYFLKLHKK